MKVTIHTDEFMKGMEEAGTDVAQRISQAMQTACIMLKDAAKERAPKNSGRIPSSGGNGGPIKNSIAWQMAADDGKGSATGTVYSNATYAVYYHEGTGLFSRTGMGRKDVPWSFRDDLGGWHSTSGMEAHPFLEEAADESRNEIARIFYAYLTQGGNG
jgi:HK97 gp10 family phage protein